MKDFESMIRDLNLGLFAQITSQSTESDKRSLLAIQAAVRELPRERERERERV